MRIYIIIYTYIYSLSTSYYHSVRINNSKNGVNKSISKNKKFYNSCLIVSVLFHIVGNYSCKSRIDYRWNNFIMFTPFTIHCNGYAIVAFSNMLQTTIYYRDTKKHLTKRSIIVWVIIKLYVYSIEIQSEKSFESCCRLCRYKHLLNFFRINTKETY